MVLVAFCVVAALVCNCCCCSNALGSDGDVDMPDVVIITAHSVLAITNIIVALVNRILFVIDGFGVRFIVVIQLYID
jgi:hypothetical protein